MIYLENKFQKSSFISSKYIQSNTKGKWLTWTNRCNWAAKCVGASDDIQRVQMLKVLLNWQLKHQVGYVACLFLLLFSLSSSHTISSYDGRVCTNLNFKHL